MITRPSVENVVAISTVESPVTHTALVDVKSASTRDIVTPSSVERGTISSTVPKNIIITKAEARSSAGLVLRRIMLTKSREISIREKTPTTASIYILFEKAW